MNEALLMCLSFLSLVATQRYLELKRTRWLAVLVVASEGLTGRSDLAKALHLLSEFPIAGVVLNRAAETTPGYDYGYDSDADKGASDKGI